MRKFTTKELAIAGILIALDIVIVRFVSIETPITRVSFGFITTALMGVAFNPVIAGIIGVIADFIGITLFPKGGGFFFGFSISAFAGPVIYSLLMYKKEVTVKRILLASILTTVIISLGMNTVWVHMLSGIGIQKLLLLRLPPNGVILTAKIVTLLVLLPRLTKDLRRVMETARIDK